MPEQNVYGNRVCTVSEIHSYVMLLVFDFAIDHFDAVRIGIGVPSDLFSFFLNDWVRIALIKCTPNLDTLLRGVHGYSRIGGAKEAFIFIADDLQDRNWFRVFVGFMRVLSHAATHRRNGSEEVRFFG